MICLLTLKNSVLFRSEVLQMNRYKRFYSIFMSTKPKALTTQLQSFKNNHFRQLKNDIFLSSQCLLDDNWASKQIPVNGKIGIIGGSGLDDPDILEDRQEVQVDTIFGRPSDSLIVGKISGVDCILLARHGRKHDISPTNVNYRANIWALKEAGCTHIIASTACGSLKEEVAPGNLVILDSLIDLTKKRAYTLHDGVTLGAPTGILHLPMEPIFSEELRQILISGVQELGIAHHKSGTAIVIEGPRFSTKAESNVYRSWGASVINMTTAPEAALAKEAGLLYAPVAMATDYDCWRDEGEKVSVEMVLKTFRENAAKVTQLFKHVVPKIAERSWDQHHEELRQLIKGSTM